MNNIRAKVTKEFDGVEDGKVYPRLINVGEEISGSLAETAISAGNAKETKESRAERAAAENEDAKQAALDEDVKLAAVMRAEKIGKDVEKLKLLPHDQLVALAAEHSIDLSQAPSDPEIIEAMQPALEILGVEIPSPVQA